MSYTANLANSTGANTEATGTLGTNSALTALSVNNSDDPTATFYVVGGASVSTATSGYPSTEPYILNTMLVGMWGTNRNSYSGGSDATGESYLNVFNPAPSNMDATTRVITPSNSEFTRFTLFATGGGVSRGTMQGQDYLSLIDSGTLSLQTVEG